MSPCYQLSDLPEELRSRIIVNPLTGCWEWQHDDGPDPYEYGRVYLDGEAQYTHKAVYVLLAGPIIPGLVLDHVYALGCRAKSCCWPAHLEPVTTHENLARGARASIRKGIASTVLRHIAAGTCNPAEKALASAAWMLPFPPHPGFTPRRRSPAPCEQESRSLPVPSGAWLDRLYTETELAEYLQLSEKTLGYWRTRGIGPKWFRAGKHVRYRKSAVEDWEAAQEREAASSAASA